MKDNNNLLTFNQWTCGDYEPSNEAEHDNDNFTILRGAKVNYTNEFSYDNEYSVKSILIQGSELRVNYRKTFDTKTIIFKGKIYSPEDKIYIRLTNNTLSTGVMVNALDKVQEVQLSLTANSYNGIYIYFTQQGSNKYSFYLDDISLTTS